MFWTHPETPGGCFGHYADIQATGFRDLSAGQQVELTQKFLASRRTGTTTAR